MKIEVFADESDVMRRGADIVSRQINKRPNTVLGLPTGSTPIGMYKELSAMCADKKVSFRNVTTFNLDEYYPISSENEQSYRYFMNKNLFSHIDIDPSRTHVPPGQADDPKRAGEEYDRMIEAAGGIDLQVLGVGRNGHIGFNEPAAFLTGGTHLTSLTADTIDANSRFFDSADDVPKHAITMGLASIMKAKSILLLVTGEEKQDALSRLLSGRIDPMCPVTMLNMHPDVTVLCDQKAYSSLYLGIDVGGTEIKYGVVTECSELKESFSVDTCTESADRLLSQITDICRGLIKKHRIKAVGIGLPCCVDPNTGIVGSSANIPLSGVCVGKHLQSELNLPVSVNNDANCAVWAEYVLGAGKNTKNCILLTLGTGVGSGMIIDGKLSKGSRGYAGEMGHTILHPGGKQCGCGQQGCFEKYASTSALCELAEEAVKNAPSSILASSCSERINGKTIFNAVKNGCPVAENVLKTWLYELKSGIINIDKLFDPDIVILGGGIISSSELFMPQLKEQCNGINLSDAFLGSTAGMIGAALLAKEME